MPTGADRVTDLTARTAAASSDPAASADPASPTRTGAGTSSVSALPAKPRERFDTIIFPAFSTARRRGADEIYCPIKQKSIKKPDVTLIHSICNVRKNSFLGGHGCHLYRDRGHSPVSGMAGSAAS